MSKDQTTLKHTIAVSPNLPAQALGLSEAGNLVLNGKAVHRPCVDASIVVNPTATSPRSITIQLKDGNGNDIDYVEVVEALVFSDANMTAFTTTGGSTGLAIGTDGALLATVAKKRFMLTSEADGDIDLTHTDTGTDACFLVLRLPNGVLIPADRVHTIGT